MTPNDASAPPSSVSSFGQKTIQIGDRIYSYGNNRPWLTCEKGSRKGCKYRKAKSDNVPFVIWKAQTENERKKLEAEINFLKGTPLPSFYYIIEKIGKGGEDDPTYLVTEYAEGDISLTNYHFIEKEDIEEFLDLIKEITDRGGNPSKDRDDYLKSSPWKSYNGKERLWIARGITKSNDENVDPINIIGKLLEGKNFPSNAREILKKIKKGKYKGYDGFKKMRTDLGEALERKRIQSPNGLLFAVVSAILLCLTLAVLYIFDVKSKDTSLQSSSTSPSTIQSNGNDGDLVVTGNSSVDRWYTAIKDAHAKKEWDKVIKELQEYPAAALESLPDGNKKVWKPKCDKERIECTGGLIRFIFDECLKKGESLDQKGIKKASLMNLFKREDFRKEYSKFIKLISGFMNYGSGMQYWEWSKANWEIIWDLPGMKEWRNEEIESQRDSITRKALDPKNGDWLKPILWWWRDSGKLLSDKETQKVKNEFRNATMEGIDRIITEWKDNKKKGMEDVLETFCSDYKHNLGLIIKDSHLNVVCDKAKKCLDETDFEHWCEYRYFWEKKATEIGWIKEENRTVYYVSAKLTCKDKSKENSYWIKLEQNWRKGGEVEKSEITSEEEAPFYFLINNKTRIVWMEKQEVWYIKWLYWPSTPKFLSEEKDDRQLPAETLREVIREKKKLSLFNMIEIHFKENTLNPENN